MTEGSHFYGKEAPYHIFAGKAVSRALALGSLEQADIDLADEILDFTPSQEQELRERIDFYREKYPRFRSSSFVDPGSLT